MQTLFSIKTKILQLSYLLVFAFYSSQFFYFISNYNRLPQIEKTELVQYNHIPNINSSLSYFFDFNASDYHNLSTVSLQKNQLLAYCYGHRIKINSKFQKQIFLFNTSKKKSFKNIIYPTEDDTYSSKI